MKSGLLSILILAFVGTAIAASTSNVQYHISGSGTTTLSGIMQTLSFAFRDIDTTTLFSFTGTSSGSGQASSLAGVTDFGAVNAFPAPSNLAGLQKFNTLLHSSDALMPVYNIPGIASEQLVINDQVLFSIWSNKTIWWDDAALQALNPTVILPHERIRIVYRPDSAGTNLAWLLYLNSVGSYPVPIATQPAQYLWPFNTNTTPVAPTPANTPVAQSPYIIPGAGSSQYAAAKVASTPYSTGYLSQLPANQYGVPNFKMINKAGKTVSPTSDSVAAALKYALSPGATMYPKIKTYVGTVAASSSPVGTLLECVNSPAPDAWPIPEYNIFLLPDNLHSDCFRALEMVQFLMWSISSDTARQAITKLLASPLPDVVANPILDVLAQSTCGVNADKKIFDTMFPYETSIYAVAIFFAVFFWCVGIAAILKREHPSIKRVGIITLVTAAIFFGLNFFTVMLWIGFPTEDMCKSRMWISACSFVVLYGGIIYVFQDRVFNRLNIHALISETLSTNKEASDDVSDVVKTISGASETNSETGLTRVDSGNTSPPSAGGSALSQSYSSAGTSAYGSGYASGSYPSYGGSGSYPSYGGSGSGVGASMGGSSHRGIRSNPRLILTLRLILVIVLGCANFLIPIIWQVIEPPKMQFRHCVGSFANTFRQAMLFYNILLIVILCIGALTQRNRAHFTSWPVHVMLLAAALFIPTNLMYSSGSAIDIPDRSPLAIFLSPAVGIVVSNAISGLLVLLPPVVNAYIRSIHDEVGELAIEAQIDQVKSRIKAQASGVEMPAGNAPTIDTKAVADAVAVQPQPLTITDA